VGDLGLVALPAYDVDEAAGYPNYPGGAGVAGSPLRVFIAAVSRTLQLYSVLDGSPVEPCPAYANAHPTLPPGGGATSCEVLRDPTLLPSGDLKTVTFFVKVRPPKDAYSGDRDFEPGPIGNISFWAVDGGRQAQAHAPKNTRTLAHTSVGD